jgi:hypothetical protein
MEGSFSFDATPMAPPGTEILVHLKPSRQKSWSFHAANGWYIGPSLKHYCCICTIMAGTGGEQLTDKFCFKNHAMPIPTITPTDRIIAATRHLTDAIVGIQEAPPDKLQAILTLCQLLLGKSSPVPIPIDPPSVPAPQEVDTPNIPLQLDDMDNEPIHMWDPSLVPQHVPMEHHHIITFNNKDHPCPMAIIEQDEITYTQAPPHPKPPIRTRAQQCPNCTQHQSAHVHLINSAITDALMPLIDIKPACDYPTHGYIATSQALLVHTYGIVPTT